MQTRGVKYLFWKSKAVKRISLILALFLVLALFCACGQGEGTHDGADDTDNIPQAGAAFTAKIITLNMFYMLEPESGYVVYRGQTADDYTMEKRYKRFLALVDYYTPDVLLLQEVNGRGGWWDFLIGNEDSFLNLYPKYKYAGNTNNAGGSNGSGGADTLYNQVYYNADKYEAVAEGTFFCRDDKTKPESQYDGDFEGVYSPHNTATCTYAVLRDKETNVTAVFASTHLCTRPTAASNFRSYGQARNLTEGLFEIAQAYQWGNDPLPVLVGGDFNGYETDENYMTYAHMTEEARYTDAKKAAKGEDNSGTARIFGKDVQGRGGTDANGVRIDYIFMQGASVEKYEVAKGTFAEDEGQTQCEYYPDPSLDGSQYDLSDHLPVYVRAKIESAGTSVAPQTYVNPKFLSDTVREGEAEITATSVKIVFDSAKLLDYIGGNENKGMAAALVADETYGTCLRLAAEKSRVDARISFDYAKLMQDLGQERVSADECKKIRVEYSASITKDASSLFFGGSTDLMVPLSAGLNAVSMPHGDGWTIEEFDFAALSEFWKGKVTYLGILTDVGMLAGDAVYIRSIEFVF